MTEKVYLQNYAKIIQRNIKRIREQKDTEPQLKFVVESFINYLYGQNYSLARISYYLDKLVRLIQIIKLSLDEKEILDILYKMREQTQLSETSKEEYIRVFKMLLIYHFKLEGDEKILRLLKFKKRKDYKKIPEAMLTYEEVKQLVNVAPNYRDKAFIMALYESGARIGEILTMQYKDVSFDKYGSILNFENSKTLKQRKRLVFSTPFLVQWIETHPTKKPNDWLWSSLKPLNKSRWNGEQAKYSYERITYHYLHKCFVKYAKKCNLTKPINFHNFRKSRATDLAKKLSDQQLKQYMGWSRNSRMAAIYVHLDETELEKDILKLNGIDIEENKPIITSKVCDQCSNINQPESKFCSKCGNPLDKALATDLNGLKDEIISSGLSLRDFVAKNKDKKFPDIVEELVKLNREVLEAMKGK